MPRTFNPTVYIEANRPHGTIYIGVTSDLPRRHHEHETGTGSTFTRKYNVHRLVWYEQHATMESAIARETSLKNLPRARKVKLIEAMNPNWEDLANHLTTWHSL